MIIVFITGKMTTTIAKAHHNRPGKSEAAGEQRLADNFAVVPAALGLRIPSPMQQRAVESAESIDLIVNGDFRSDSGVIPLNDDDMLVDKRPIMQGVCRIGAKVSGLCGTVFRRDRAFRPSLENAHWYASLRENCWSPPRKKLLASANQNQITDGIDRTKAHDD